MSLLQQEKNLHIEDKISFLSGLKPAFLCAFKGCNNKTVRGRNKYCSQNCRWKDFYISNKNWKEQKCKLEICNNKINGKNNKFCSLRCSGIFKTHKNKLNKKNCKFISCNNKVKNNAKEYCSLKCYGLDKRKNKKCEYNSCPNSNKSIYIRDDRHFCSRECYLAQNNKLRESKPLKIKREFNYYKTGDIKVEKLNKNSKIPARKIFVYSENRKRNYWKLLAQDLWEKKHKMQLPEKHHVVFKDGNQFNDEDLNNIMICKIQIGKSCLDSENRIEYLEHLKNN